MIPHLLTHALSAHTHAERSHQHFISDILVPQLLAALKGSLSTAAANSGRAKADRIVLALVLTPFFSPPVAIKLLRSRASPLPSKASSVLFSWTIGKEEIQNKGQETCILEKYN